MTGASLLLGLGVAGGGVEHGSVDILASLAIILCVAAATTVIFQRIRQPVVLGYLLAGLIVGPHVMVPLFADVQIAHLFSDLGVILLMFTLGLEFTLGKLARVGPTAGVVALIECSLMIWLGYAVAGFFGWTGYERLFVGAFVAISSTTIIVKAFAEQGIAGKLAEIVFGILIVEDLIAILVLAVLTTVASGAGLSAGALGATIARLAGFLAGMLVVGILTIPRLVRAITLLGRAETTVVASVGICFACALVARKFGYSVALGSFIGGVLVAESGEAKTIEHVIEPVRDVFAGVFFVSVGMLIDPKLVAAHWLAIAVLTTVVVLGKVFGVTLGAFIAGNGIRTSLQTGMSLAQIGEFSFIIVGVGLSLGVVREFLYPIAIAISAVTTLLTPWLVRLAGPAANYVDRRLPHALQTWAALYGSWVQQLRATPHHRTAWAGIRRRIALLFVDVALVAAIVIATSLNLRRLVILAASAGFLNAGVARFLVILAASVVAAPFVIGAVRVARALGLALASLALPSLTGEMDMAAAPRRALLVTLQIAILLGAGLPLLALTQPFLPAFPWAVVLASGVLALAVPFWRGAANLDGHVRAGAQVILEALGAQTHTAEPRAEGGSDIKQLLPGIGDATVLRMGPDDFGSGKTLKWMNLRGRTGASVIAVQRQGGKSSFPAPDEVLREGDVLVLTGTSEAVAAARALLRSGPATAELAEPGHRRSHAAVDQQD